MGDALFVDRDLQLNHVEPYAYLHDVLQRMVTGIRSIGSTNCCRGIVKRQKLSRSEACATARRYVERRV
jgi:transposase